MAGQKEKGKAGKVFAWIAVVLAVIFAVGLMTSGRRDNTSAASKKDLTALENAVNSADLVLQDKIAAGDAALSERLEAGDNALSDKIDSEVSELEESIVFYQHDIRLNINVKSTETGGSSAALGYCSITFVNNNPNAYDCIDIGNGNNPLLGDLVSSKAANGYCLIDYRNYSGEGGRFLRYLFQNTVVAKDTAENSAYADDHLYVFVYSVWSDGEVYEYENVAKTLIPNIIVGENADGTPIYNSGRFILSDTEGIATATITDSVSIISLR